jgi:hypothetical protein
MQKPDFLLIGAQKAGTTWISSMIRQHPEICMPKKKEIHFFNKRKNFKKGIKWYKRKFKKCGKEKIVGEATPNYLWTNKNKKEMKESNRVKNIPKKVYKSCKDTKLIVSIREPLDRAISAYKTLIRGGHISPRRSITEVYHRHGIVTMGDYETHIRKWLEYFDSSQFLFLVFEEDIKKNKKSTLKKIYKFLNVDDKYVPNRIDEKKHPSLGPLYRTLLYYLPWIRPLTKTMLPNLRRDKLPFRNIFEGREVTLKEREKISKCFLDYNRNLPELIGREPVWWSEDNMY